ncbi:uncharacterized protein LOC144648517 [Oculina patagonica]
MASRCFAVEVWLCYLFVVTVLVCAHRDGHIWEYPPPPGSFLWFVHVRATQVQGFARGQKVFVSIFLGHSESLHLYAIPERLYTVFDAVGRDQEGYKRGTRWCNLCKRNADNSISQRVFDQVLIWKKENSFDKLVANFQIALYRHCEEKKEPLYHPGAMREFAEKYAPGLFNMLLQSILRDDDRLSNDDRSLQEQRTVVLLHTLAYFRCVVGPSFLTYST